jgi:hypothetical protein
MREVAIAIHDSTMSWVVSGKFFAKSMAVVKNTISMRIRSATMRMVELDLSSMGSLLERTRGDNFAS